MKVRHDAWSHEDDLLLAETVLRFIREGSTQTAAFEEVGEKLNRTAAACGFRWNSELRKQYIQAIELAKKRRKEKKRALNQLAKEEASQHKQPLNSNTLSKEITLSDCISFLQSMLEENNQFETLHDENLSLKEQNEKLLKENEQLEKKYDKLRNTQHVIENDYKMLIKIIAEARKNIVSDHEIEDEKTSLN